MLEIFINGFEKSAGVKTEVLSLIDPANILMLPGGMIRGGHESKDVRDSEDKGTWSNLLIPGMGGYRLGRRLMTDDKNIGKKKK